MITKSKTTEAILVITTALLVLYLYGVIYQQVSKLLFVYLACGIGLAGVLINPLAKIIAIGWYKLAEGLSFVSSKIILGTVFFFILFPVASLYRLLNKDKLGIRISKKSIWVNRNHTYKASDLENMW